MESPQASIRGKKGAFRAGFTLMEILMVIGLVAIIGAFSMVMGIDTLRGYAYHSDREVLVSALQHARAQAIGNICLGNSCADADPHGLVVFPDKFVVFQGTSYATRDASVDAEIQASTHVTHGGTVSEITFSQLSATTTGGNIVLSDTTSNRVSTITIGTEGQITWDN